MSGLRQIPAGSTNVPFRFNVYGTDIGGIVGALGVDIGLVEGDFAIYTADPGSNHNALETPDDPADYTITERGLGEYDLIINDSGPFQTEGISSVVVCLEGGESADTIVAKLYYEVVAAPLTTTGIADELDRRHGQGLWGGAYPKDSFDANRILGYGTWDYAWRCEEASGSLVRDDPYFRSGDNWDPVGTPDYQEYGVLGYADYAVGLTSTGSNYFEAENSSMFDVTASDDIAGIIVFRGGLPRFRKTSGTQGIELDDASDTNPRFTIDNDSVAGVSVTADGSGIGEAAIARGAILGFALSRASNRIRVGLISADGQLAISALGDTTAIDTATNASVAEILQATDEDCIVSHMLFAHGTGAATNVPEQLEEVLRAYHAHLFPAHIARKVDATTVSVQADTDNIQTRLPAALVGGRMASDVIAVSGDTTAADNLELQFNGTGLTGDTFPMRQDATISVDEAAIATASLNALLAHDHDTGVTVAGLLARLEALVSGKVTGLKGNTVRFYMKDGITVAIQATQDVAAGTRAAANVAGSE